APLPHRGGHATRAAAGGRNPLALLPLVAPHGLPDGYAGRGRVATPALDLAGRRPDDVRRCGPAGGSHTPALARHADDVAGAGAHPPPAGTRGDSRKRIAPPAGSATMHAARVRTIVRRHEGQPSWLVLPG